MLTQLKGITPTIEQASVVQRAVRGKNLVVSAFAGAAKTTTCELIASQIGEPSLYLAFSKDVATEAESKFPDNVEARTIHSIAYRAVVTPALRKKLSQFFDLNDIMNLKSYQDLDDDIELKLKVMEVIKLYCQSASKDLIDFILNLKQNENDTIYYGPNVLMPLCLEYWAVLTNERHEAKITHDVYLKMFHLTSPKLTTSVRDSRGFGAKQIPYHTIYLDEYQDSNPVTIDIVFNQTESQIILVGDRYQSIYAWRGAVNAMDFVPADFEKLYLTESFRFTQEIADKASKLITLIDNDRRIKGKANPDNYNPATAVKAVIVRNNSTLLTHLLGAFQRSELVYVMADLQDLWSKMYHISALWFNTAPKYPNKELANFRDYKELSEAAEGIPELKKLISLTTNLTAGKGLHQNISDIKSILVKTKEEADLTLTTCHKSKGLEFDEVTLSEDLIPKKYNEDGKEVALSIEELMEELKKGQACELLYVGITRAKYKVTMPVEIEEIISRLELPL